MSEVPVKKPRAKQIRPALEAAIVQMVEHGRTLSEAAQISGLQEESLQKALRKPHVKEFVSGLAASWRRGETFQSWHTVSELRKTSASDKVRLEAAKTFIGAAGELEPERDRGPGIGLALQIVVSPGVETRAVAKDGVFEALPFDPSRRLARDLIEGETA